MNVYVKNLIEERDSLAAQIAGMAEKASTEERSLTDSENGSIDSMRARIDSIDSELRRWDGFGKAVRNFTQVEAAASEQRTQREDAGKRETRSGGELYVESRAFSEFSGYGNSAKVELPWLESRAPILTSTDLGAEYVPANVAGYSPTVNLRLWNLVTKINVSDGAIRYPVYGQGSEAPVVAEGAVKPEMTWSMEMVEKTIPKVAHRVEYSREFATDKSFMKSMIDGDLRNGVLRALNTAAVNAFTGVATAPVSAGSLEESIRLAMAEVEEAEDGAEANVLLINPRDAAALDLAAMAATNGGFSASAPVWGLTVIKTGRVTAGTALVADLDAVRAYVRTGVEVFATDSHKDYFEKNLLVQVAEARALVAVQKPALIVPATTA